MQQHISTLLQHYAGQGFLCWDVVNEAVSDDGNPATIFKPAEPWYPAVQDYVERAFRIAGAARQGPELLFYNDYSAEAAGSVKSDKVYNLVKALRAKGVPLDGVGLQMHISVDGYPNPAAVSANIARLGALGLSVHITERDVRCKPPCGADRLQLQAAIYGQMLQACLNNSGVCKSFETWGFTDRLTWIGAENQPLPFDVSYNKKPAYMELLAVLSA